MTGTPTALSTGIPGLDRVLSSLRPGDNVVWEIDSVTEYEPFLGPLVREAARVGRPAIYFRFAGHAPLLTAGDGVVVHELDPQEGFERFLTGILDVIERAGPGAYYIFDCLSELAADWFSDRMLGNFFMITCPYLYELETITYFALQKNLHSSQATDAIFNTAQVIIEVYRKYAQFFIKPLKVWQRSSPTMYTLHSWADGAFAPVTNSATITDILASVPQPWLEFSIHRPGIWGEAFQRALKAVDEFDQRTPLSPAVESKAQAMTNRLITMVVTRDQRMAALAARYLTLPDLVEIMQRMVGTGLVGGKTLGMLLARAILCKADPAWRGRLEGHDSFYVGSDVFYTYLVQNGCWWLHARHKAFPACLERATDARQKILTGTFPREIEQQFLEMLEYFGQSPLIVRSSSLLEDNYGNAFSGKYESVFCANQGGPERRLEAFRDAVRTVYASAFSEDGLRYRHLHGLLDRDEQMALLVQRVSGDLHDHRFLPHLAGVAYSFNPYAWDQAIDPHAGLLRLVFGLGTRAVNRTDDDYTRLVALNAPLRQPGEADMHQYSQRRADLLDLTANALTTERFDQLAAHLPPRLRELLTASGEDLNAPSDELTFEGLFRTSDFVPCLRELLAILQQAYGCPVDVEFTANFAPDGQYRVNVVQCRPFQVKIGGPSDQVQVPAHIAPEQLLLKSNGPVVGHSLATIIDRLIYVIPATYSQAPMQQRHAVARAIGRLTHLDSDGRRPTLMLIGPGRWGTTMPALGVPTSFAEIETVSVVGELGVMHTGLIPEPSLGTHFFNDLVESGMVYLAVVPARDGHAWNEALLRAQTNHLARLLPGAAELAGLLHVVDFPSAQGAGQLVLHVDSLKQSALAYTTPGPRPA